MTTLTYIFTLAITVLTCFSSYGQCTVPSSNPNKFELLHADEQVAAQDAQTKHLTGRVVFLINDFTLYADSAVIYDNNDQFEAFGNVTLTKNGENYQSGKKAVYSKDLHFIRFDDSVVHDITNKSDALKPTETVYNVSK